MSPFHEKVAREIFKRDNGTCMSEQAVCIDLYGESAVFRQGFTVHMAHYPEMHQPRLDFNMEHGRCSCVYCHIVETIQQGNERLAKLMYGQNTFRNKYWVKEYGRDQKPSFEFFQDWAVSDELGREGLAQAFRETYNVVDYPSNDPVFGTIFRARREFVLTGD